MSLLPRPTGFGPSSLARQGGLRRGRIDPGPRASPREGRSTDAESSLAESTRIFPTQGLPTRDEDLDEASGEPFAPLWGVDASEGRIAGRYELLARLGAGANGQVYRALDRISGERVAIKRVPVTNAQQLDRIRAEVTALRWLRLPGVASLLDDGLSEGEYFVVMDLVEGRPFLGPELRTWPEIAAPVFSLLENLARVHLAGVVHRDLKPANVLLDPSERPILVDLGLARGQALAEHWNRAGTPRYVAPEQAMGEPCGPATDLYSLGVMLYEALSGGLLPQRRTGGTDLLRERAYEEPRPLCSVAPQVPPAIARVVDRLVARRVEDRFPSALEVMRALGARPPVFLGHTLRSLLERRRQLPPEALMVLFRGPDAFLHLREDAARVLWERTGGHPEEVAIEVQAWLQAGLATWEGPLLRIQRVAIERLRTDVRLAVAPPPPPTISLAAIALLDVARRAWPDAWPEVLEAVSELPPEDFQAAREELIRTRLAWSLPDGRLGIRPIALPSSDPYERAMQARIAEVLPDPSEARLRHLLLSDQPLARVLPSALLQIEQMQAQGRQAAAMALTEHALALARSHASLAGDEERLLELWASLSLSLETRAAVDRALYETGRARVRTARVEQAEALLQAALVRFLHEPERCEELLARVRPFEDEELETWRMAVAFAAVRARSAAAAERWLLAAEDWARGGSPRRRHRLDNWRGQVAYLRGDFAEAARRREATAERVEGETNRLSALINAAFSWLDGGELERARALAAEAEERARELRLAYFEARAHCVRRQAQYRAREPGAPQPALVDAAQALDRRLMAQMSIAEAGFAFRSGQVEEAMALARRGARAFHETGFPAGALALEALAWACQGGAAESEARRLLAEAAALSDPSWAVQVVGLVRIGSRALLGEPPDIGAFPQPERIIDLLSPAEARDGRLACPAPHVPTEHP